MTIRVSAASTIIPGVIHRPHRELMQVIARPVETNQQRFMQQPQGRRQRHHQRADHDRAHTPNHHPQPDRTHHPIIETPSTLPNFVTVSRPQATLPGERYIGHDVLVTTRSVRPLSLAQLEALTTERLLAYRSRLLSLEASASSSDLDGSEIGALDSDLLYFKTQPAWGDLYAHVRRVLAARGHDA